MLQLLPIYPFICDNNKFLYQHIFNSEFIHVIYDDRIDRRTIHVFDGDILRTTVTATNTKSTLDTIVRFRLPYNFIFIVFLDWYLQQNIQYFVLQIIASSLH